MGHYLIRVIHDTEYQHIIFIDVSLGKDPYLDPVEQS